MKTKFLFAALLVSLSVVLSSYSMNDGRVYITIRNANLGHNNGPRTETPITASIENDIITTEVSTYSGTISVSIEDEDGETVISSAENVLPNSQFTTNVTSLDDGNYTIFYTLSDSTVYYGEFVK